jgi:predicted transcriptional regulator
MTPQVMGHLTRTMQDKILEGVKLRSIFNENIREAKSSLPKGKNVERKLLPKVPVIMIISEKEASISFPRLDGNIDFPAFFGTDSTFLKWITDLFLYYWERAKLWYSP